MSKTCSEIVREFNDLGNATERPCGRPVLEDKNRCMFHDPEAWKTHRELIITEIKKKIALKDFNFQKYHFPEIDFRKLIKTFNSTVDFSDACFHKTVKFIGIDFLENANFRGATFLGFIDFSETTFYKETRFFSTKFLDSVYFWNATFLGNAWFSSVTFTKWAFFQGVVFSKNVSFREVSFSERVDFSKSTFSGEADFDQVCFSNEVWFAESKFDEYVSFSKAIFPGDAYFTSARFLNYVWFNEVTFSDTAGFTGATFARNAWFTAVAFLGDAWFDGVFFSNEADFSGVTFSGVILFDNASFSHLVSLNKLNMKDIEFSFKNTLFERGINVDEEKWANNGFRLKIEDIDLRSAVDSYQALKNGFRNLGHHSVAGELFFREMICRKNNQTLCKIINISSVKNRLRYFFEWLWMRFFYYSCGFGERPIYVIFGIFMTILIFMVCYLPIVELYRDWGRVVTALLLSIDAFTPGKFLLITFDSIGDILVQVENFVGWFMLSLFLLVFTRKMIRS